mgnify:CR=1 FL=1
MELKVYKIEIRELLSETLEIEANDLKEAISKAKKLYDNEKIILSEQNYINTEFKFSH